MIFLCCLTTCSLKLIAWGMPHFQLVHSNGFSLLCMDIAHVKLLDLSEIYSHWLHLWDFTSKDFLFTVYSSCNMLGQMLHLTSFSPGCIFICTFSVFAWETKYSHLLHFCDFSPHMTPHNICLRGGIITLAAFVRLHSIMLLLHVYFEFETEIWIKKSQRIDKAWLVPITFRKLNITWGCEDPLY